MTTELDNIDVVDETPVDQPDNSTTNDNTDPYEEEARSQGWRPQEEWDGEGKAWRPAKEFVERGELFGKISDLKGENKQIKQALQALTEHHQKVKETEFKHAIDYLREQKKKALEEGDADRLLQVEDAIDVVKEQAAQEKQTQQVQQQQGPTPTFTKWVQANSWYVTDSELRQYADELGVGFFQRNPDKSEAEVYDYVVKRVRQTYPKKFSGQGTKTPTVEGSSGNSRPAKANTFSLSEDEERVMKTFVRTGVMTKDEYIKELQRVKSA